MDEEDVSPHHLNCKVYKSLTFNSRQFTYWHVYRALFANQIIILQQEAQLLGIRTSWLVLLSLGPDTLVSIAAVAGVIDTP